MRRLALVGVLSGSALVDGGSTCVPLVDHGTMYTTQVGVGTPFQFFDVVPDTGSYDFVVASKLCSDAACMTKSRYDLSLSSTAVPNKTKQVLSSPTLTLTYGQGGLTVRKLSDRVGVDNRVQQDNVKVLAVETETLTSWGQISFDGIMGLGKLSRTNLDDKVLLEELGIDSFSMCLSHGGGRLEFGSQIPAATGYRSLKTVGAHAWATILTSVSVDGGEGRQPISDVSVCGPTGRCGAIIDSGTTLLTMPKLMQEKLLKSIDSQCGESGCLAAAVNSPTCSGAAFDALPTISFHMSSVWLDLQPHEYMGRMKVSPSMYEKLAPFVMSSYSAGTHCVPLFMGQDTSTDFGPLVIMGMPFLRAYATQFNRNSKQMSVAHVRVGSDLCRSCKMTKRDVLREDRKLSMSGMKQNILQENNAIDVTETYEASSMSPVIDMEELSTFLPWWSVEPSKRPVSVQPRQPLVVSSKENAEVSAAGILSNGSWVLKL